MTTTERDQRDREILRHYHGARRAVRARDTADLVGHLVALLRGLLL